MNHAILIMAHNNTEVVKSAMRLLDDRRFTFYLHIDKKSSLTVQDFIPQMKYAKWVEIPPITVNWGGYSAVQAEMNMLEAAVQDRADYIHFLQGADMPLKTPKEIDDFFIENTGKNYICFQPERYEFAKYKLLCKHFFVDFPSYRYNTVLKIINHAIAHLQKPFIEKNVTIYHSSALYSITYDFALYMLSRKKEIQKRYRFALAPDELFICNLFMESPFRDTLGDKTGARLIDWDRREGNSPRTFTMEDMDMICDAILTEGIMFARKFSEERDIEIIKEVEEIVMHRRCVE